MVFNIREQGNLARVLGGEGTATIVQNEGEMTMPAYDKADLQRRMDGAVEALKHDLGGLRTGRASTTLLDPVHVEVYGANMPLNQVATDLGARAAHALGPGLGPVERRPGREGDPQRRARPQPDRRRPEPAPADPRLTEERRKELAKLAHQYAEKARIAVRNVRRDGMDALKNDEKKHEISEDEHKRLEHRGPEADRRDDRRDRQVLAAKEKEILQK